MSEHLLVVCGLSDHEGEIPQGYRVEAADDGFRTIELVERMHPAAVLFHVDAPGPAPTELVERIRQVEPSCRVLVAVSAADPERDSTLIAAGVAGIVLWPAYPAFLRYAFDRIRGGGLALDAEVAAGLGQAMVESVTQRTEWARQLADRTRQAEELARAKSDFLGNVSHELRTPLTIIKGVAATLRMSEQDENQSRMLSQIETATDKLVTMIESIITHASMKRGDYSINVVHCDLSATIRDAALDAAKGHPNVDLELVVPAQVQANADVRAIRGVVHQLVDNACRYSDAGGAVTVKVRSGEEGATVHVTDRGVGVNRDKVAAALAEAFSPGEAIMTKERAGLGIGLNLARNLVALHGGILWAEPLPGGGTRVSFTIPPDPDTALQSEPAASLDAVS